MMKSFVQEVLDLLDAGKAVRIAEQDLSCVPHEPRWGGGDAPPKSDTKRYAQWHVDRQRFDERYASYERAKEQAEAKLEAAAGHYVGRMMTVLHDDLIGVIEEYVTEALLRRFEQHEQGYYHERGT